MPESINKNIAFGHQDGSTLIPIRVSSLRLDTITGFDVYFVADHQQPPVLYCERHIKFTESHRRRLEDSQVEYLYIDSSEAEIYRQYVEKNLPVILEDSSLAVGEKSEILYVSAQGLVKDVFANPSDINCIERSRELVENTVHFMFMDRSAFEHLLKATSYDYFTYTHSINVCVYGIALAQRVGFDEPELLKRFGNGLLLHDVGKSQIDPSILSSSNRLTQVQWELYKQHPVFGQEILAKTDGFDNTALDVVRHHHEKLSGTGYPDRLTDSAILPLTRISTISDVFDSMTTNRPYKKGCGTYEALRMMKEDLSDDLDELFLRTFIEMMGAPTLPEQSGSGKHETKATKHE